MHQNVRVSSSLLGELLAQRWRFTGVEYMRACAVKPLTPKATIEHPYLAVCQEHLSKVPSILGRLAWLAQLRDSKSNRYGHANYGHSFGCLEVDRVLRFVHTTLFDHWLGLTLEDQMHDFLRFITSPIDPVEYLTEAESSRQPFPFVAVLPSQAISPDRKLFLSGISILLALMRSRVRAAADTGDFNRRVSRLLLIIEGHAAPWQLTLDGIANEVNLSGDYARHLFKAATGLTVRQFLRYLRISRAARLLRTTFLSVEEVAVRLDYEYATNFSRDFHGSLCITPTAYRSARGQSECPFGEIRIGIAESDRQYPSVI